MRVLLAAATLLYITAAALATAQLPDAAEHPATAYSTSTPSDAVAKLQERIDTGEVTLAFDEARGYLPAIIRRTRAAGQQADGRCATWISRRGCSAIRSAI